MKIIKTAILFGLWGAFFASVSQRAHASELIQDRNATSIYVYNRIGEDAYPEQNIRAEQFAAHIQDIISENYPVVRLEEIINAIQNNTSLPENALAITFDGGHASILKEAVPLLLEHNLPFTVFVSTDNLDANKKAYLNWSDIKKFARQNSVSFGLHPARYDRISHLDGTGIKHEINNAKARFRDQMGDVPSFFAYPFGEFSALYRDVISQAGFDAAFGLQSGVASESSDLFALPRFSMTERYGSIERFRLTAKAKPLHVSAITPNDMMLQNNRPEIGFSVDKSLVKDWRDLKCFISNVQDFDMQEFENGRVEIRMDQDLYARRTRVNCTMPTVSDDEIVTWRWLGMMFIRDEMDETNFASQE